MTPRGRGQLQIVAVGWDPEGILAAPQGGHIQRRNLQKQLQTDKELAEQVEKERLKARDELMRARELRAQPTSHLELVEYFLNTEGDEMQYEVARCRPLVSAEFITFLGQAIGEERFAKRPNEGRVAELEALQEFLKDAVAAFDAQQATIVAPLDRMKLLLTSKDKRATLLEMAGNNQIDQPLLDLLQQNISAARAGGQEEAAQFMEKIHLATKKFLITV